MFDMLANVSKIRIDKVFPEEGLDQKLVTNYHQTLSDVEHIDSPQFQTQQKGAVI